MRTYPTIFLPLLGAAFSTVPLSAQTSPRAASAADAAAGETITLSPFDVKSTRDTGYRATDSKTSTGIALELARIPLNIQVITSQFVEDLSFVSMHETLRYTSGV